MHIQSGPGGEVAHKKMNVLLTLLTIVFVFAGVFYVLETYMLTPDEMLEQWGVENL